MSNKDLREKPHHINNTDKIWWYEESAGMCIVTSPYHPSYGSVNCEIRVIPWKTIRAALKRKEKK